MAYTFRDYRGETIFLSEQVYQVALTKHPEAKLFFDFVAETLVQPDIVKKSQKDTRTSLYYRYFSQVLNGKFVVIVVKFAEQYFVSTFYATDKIKQGEVVWKK